MDTTRTKERFFQAEQYNVIFPSEERMRLAKLAREGDDEACAKLIFAMTRLILKRAIREYHIPFDELEDLVQEVYLELFRVFSAWQPKDKKILKFNPELGYNPITYAHMHITKAIQIYLANNRSSIRLSRKNSLLISKARNLLSSQESLSQNEVEKYINDFIEKKHITLKTFLAAFQAYDVLSLDRPINREESKLTYLDLVSNSQEDSPLAYAINEAWTDYLYAIMEKALSERETLVLKLRHSSEGRPFTYRQISRKLGKIEFVNKKTGEKTYRFLSGERIRQTNNSAESKLKNWMDSHPQDSDILQKLFRNTS